MVMVKPRVKVELEPWLTDMQPWMERHMDVNMKPYMKVNLFIVAMHVVDSVVNTVAMDAGCPFMIRSPHVKVK